MAKYFGTDGIRGVAGEDLTARVAFALGNALCRLREKPRVVLGRDTRPSSPMLALALAAGVASGGGKVLDGGVLPTAAVAFFVRREDADFGAVVSASHNPARYNGLKLFDENGCKLSERAEERAEKFFGDYLHAPSLSCGVRVPLRGKGAYADSLAEDADLRGKTFVLDCAFGAAGRVAPALFRRLGAKVIALNCSGDGRRINDGCGALYPASVCRAVRETGADAGFCYDGDADRLIACDERGNIVDGDKVLCIFARELHRAGKLTGGIAVGTAHTNSGVERALAREGITLLRTDVGDKYVAECMRRTGAAVGGEQSGHVILAARTTTGDGILTSVRLAALLRRRRLSELSDFPLFPQYNLSVTVKDKVRVLGNAQVQAACEREKAGVARLIVRASGTEPVVRIFAEAEDVRAAKAACERVRRAVALAEK